jgi:hypothetical protein
MQIIRCDERGWKRLVLRDWQRVGTLWKRLQSGFWI